MRESKIGGFTVVEPEWYEMFKESKNKLSNRPNKECTIATYHEIISSISPWLIFAGINSERIRDYALEAWSFRNIRLTNTWMKRTLYPVILEMQEFINRQSPDYWKQMFDFNPNHGDFHVLNKFKDKVRRTWWTRPRFKQDKGRVQEEGY